MKPTNLVAIFDPDGRRIEATVCYSRKRARGVIAKALCVRWHDAWERGYRCRRADALPIAATQAPLCASERTFDHRATHA